MNKFLTAAVAALTIGGAVAASVPASAQQHGNWHGGNGGAHNGGGGGGWHGNGGGNWRGGGYRGGGYHNGNAVAAGIAGLAIGAALANSGNGYYGGNYYYGGPPPAYYNGPSYYSYYDQCHSEWRWDRYRGRYIRVRACY